MRIGELFAGYGGLGMGVQAVIGGEVVWFSEFDAAPSKILAHNFPGIPNHGDITKIDWSTVEPVDVLTGGFPCQDVSLAGARKGLMEGTRSGLWSEFAKAIDALRPGLVVIENVRGLLSAKTVEEVDEEAGDLEPESGGVGELGRGDRPVLNAFGRVLGDLAELGYDAEWVGVRAADAGATHGRYRVFILAHPSGGRCDRGPCEPIWHPIERAVAAGSGADAPPDSRDRELALEQVGKPWGVSAPVAADDVHGAAPADADSAGREQHGGGVAVPQEHEAPQHGSAVDWGDYAPAIERWESVMNRPAPSPTKPDGKGGSHRLSAVFVEWMMGIPAGHVTNPDIWIGMSANGARNAQLKALGNGVVWQQAALAVGTLLARTNSHERIAA